MKKIIRVISILIIFALLFNLTGCDWFKNETLTYSSNSEMSISKLKEEYGYEDLYLKPMYNLEKDHEFTLAFNTDVSGTKVPGRIVQVYSSPDFSEENKVQIKEERRGNQVIITPPDADYGHYITEEEKEKGGKNWGGASSYYMRIYFNPYSSEVERLEIPLTMVFTIKSELNVPNLKFSLSNDGKAMLSWNKIDGATEYKIYKSIIDASLVKLEEIAKVSSESFDINSLYESEYLMNSSFTGAFYVKAVSENKESNLSNPIKADDYISNVPYMLEDKFSVDVDTVGDLPVEFKVKMKDNSIQIFKCSWDTENVINNGSLKCIQGSINGTIFKIKGYVKEITNVDELKKKEEENKKDVGFVEPDIIIDPAPPKELPNNKPEQNKPEQNKPEQNKPEQNKPEQNTPEQNKPEQNKPEQNKPEQNKPEQNTPEQNKPEQNKPEQNKPEQNTPEQNTPEQNKPEQNKPEQNKPEQNKPEQNKPEQNKPEQNKPEQNTPEQNKPEQNTPEQNKPEQNTPEQNKPEQNTPEQNKPEQNTPEQNKPEQNKPEQNKPEQNTPEQHVPNTENNLEIDSRIHINADNAFEQYLTRCLLNAQTSIDLSQFNEASNTSYLSDTLYKVMYQNPLIMKIDAIQYDYYTNNLIVDYMIDDTEKIIVMQKEILNKIDQIVSSTINSSMSYYEKELAINDYLVKNAEYDDKLCDVLENNNFKSVPDEYTAEYTAYGILCMNKGVCAGYGDAFKLLCDAAGLPCIVVTGTGGGVPHEWNKVKIEGSYYIVDVTWNDDENIENMSFNTTDAIEGVQRSEDKYYELDKNISKYQNRATTSKYEWYTYNKKTCSSKEELKTKLVTFFNSSEKKFVTRTTFNISQLEMSTLFYELSGVKYRGGFNYLVVNNIVVIQKD